MMPDNIRVELFDNERLEGKYNRKYTVPHHFIPKVVRDKGEMARQELTA